jgi:hypothetical protein
MPVCDYWKSTDLRRSLEFMSKNIKEHLIDGITLLSGLCTAGSLFLDRPVLFCILLAVTIGLLVRRGVIKPDSPTDVDNKFEIEPVGQIAGMKTDEKQWIDCAYCQGTGSVMTYNDGHTQRSESCGICNGHGQVLTDLWDRPGCRRCGGSGRLVSKQYTPSLHVIGRRILKHHQYDTEIQPCDVCRGLGKRPWHAEERNNKVV